MGTNQSNFNATDGTTYFYYDVDGLPLHDYTGSEPGGRDGCHGMLLFSESRGYSVEENFNQYILNSVRGNTTEGFTFADFQAEVDAGRPVLIHVEGHSMVGFGYDTVTGDIYIHDTWDHSDHTMAWGGIYSTMEHYAVTVIQLGHLRITDGPEGDPNPVTGGEPVQCSVTAVDDLGHDLTYEWSAAGDVGSFNDATAQNPIWTAPEDISDSIVEYQISVTVTCSGGQSVTSSYIQQVKWIRPKIEILYPLTNTVIFSTTPLIQASITDPDSGVDESSIVLTIDTDVYTLGDFTYNAGSGLLVYDADLDAGLHEVTVRAKNNDGDEAEKTVYFRILQKSFDAGLHLFSLPYTYDPGGFPTPDTLFGLSSGDVAMHRWWPEDSDFNKYRTYPDNYGTFNPPDAMGGNPIVDSPPAGLGYFVRLPEKAAIQEPGIILDNSAPTYEINLTYGLVPPRGWNIIGCPYSKAVGWGSFQFVTNGKTQSIAEAIEDGVTNGILWEFVSTGDGGYYDFPTIPLSATIEPFKGYWIHVWQDTTLRLYAPSAGVAGVTPAGNLGNLEAEGDWQLQIIASAGGDIDPCNYIGAASTATSGYDPGLDVTEPPSVGSAIQCYQPRADWDGYSGNYARDIRSTVAGSQTWDVEVSCQLGGVPVRVTWPELNSAVPGAVKLMLEDVDTGQQVYMRTVAGYSFTSAEGGDIRHLRITSYDSSVTSLTLTGVSAQAMPPSSGAVITYNLSKPAMVTTEICNISGVIIKGLGERSSSGSRVEMVLWDGRSDHGTRVPAGRYLARITACAADGQTVQAVRPFVILP